MDAPAAKHVGNRLLAEIETESLEEVCSLPIYFLRIVGWMLEGKVAMPGGRSRTRLMTD